VQEAVRVEVARRVLLAIAFARKHFLKEEIFVFGIATRELSRQVQEELGAEWARRRGVTIR